MLSGFGGDEFVTSAANVALVQWMAEKKYLQLYSNLGGNHFVRLKKLLRLLLTYVKKSQYNLGYLKSINKRWLYQVVRQVFVEKYHLHDRFLGIAKFDAGYTRLNDFIIESRNEAFLHTRLECCSLLASSRKLEYRWPLLDVRLIEFFLSIPVEEKYAKGVGRFLHKRAVNDLLPEKIVWKSNKSMGAYISSRTALDIPDINPLALNSEICKIIDCEKIVDQIYGYKNQSVLALSEERIQLYRNAKNILWLNQWIKEDKITS